MNYKELAEQALDYIVRISNQQTKNEPVVGGNIFYVVHIVSFKK